MNRLTLSAGVGLVALGLFFVMLPRFRQGEKADAIFFVGHWFDVVWELGVPSFGMGIFLCIIGTIRRRTRKA